MGNKGYRKYLKTQGQRLVIDEDKLKAEARFYGKWVSRTSKYWRRSAQVQAAVDGRAAVSLNKNLPRHAPISG